MPYTEERNGRWRVRWRRPDGAGYDSASRDEYGVPFPDEDAARIYGLDQEADIRRGIYKDPRAERMTLAEWAGAWYKTLELERSTMKNYRRAIEGHILGPLGHLALRTITPETIKTWERGIREAGYAVSTAETVRAVLGAMLADAHRAHHIISNPAARPRGKGRKADRRVQAFERVEKAWSSPIEALLIAERVALLSGRDSDFVMVLLAMFTGLRWSEVLALTAAALDDEAKGTLKVHWKLYEDDGDFYWGRPKDGSMREVDVPMWLWDMLRAIKPRRCDCPADAKPPFCKGREVLFLGARQHHRRSAFSRLYLRPAADGMYPATSGRPARPVLADASTSWPGVPLEAWPAAVPGVEFVPPVLRHIVRQRKVAVGSRSSRAELVAYAIKQGADPAFLARASREVLLQAYVRPRADALVSWAPVRKGLTYHGLRHGQQTAMDNGRIKDSLKVERMGHTDASISAHYGHVTPEMRAELIELLDGLWDAALRARLAFGPRSLVRVLDGALMAIDGASEEAPFSHFSPKMSRARLSG